MDNIVEILIVLHSIGGLIALLTFAIPLATKKGGKHHIFFGRVYVWAMVEVIVTVLLIGGLRFLDPASTLEVMAFSAFLVMIAIFAGSALWSGIAVLKMKRRQNLEGTSAPIFWTIVRVLSAFALSVYGYTIDSQLLVWFPLLPIWTGVQELRYWLKIPLDPMHWWFFHLNCMFTACIATVTAFAVTALPRTLGVSHQNILIWIAPTIILVPLMIAMKRHYTLRFALR